MALPMVHLIAALQWAEKHPEFRGDPQYYLGAISPDAIHIRDGNDKSRKNRIHLNNWVYPHPEEVLSYWQAHLTPFDVGYGIHVLTDCQWVRRFHEQFPEMLKPDGKPYPEIYYNDACVTDFELYAKSAQTPFLLDMLRRAHGPEDHPLLSRYEIEAWRDQTLAFYQRECPMKNPVRFFTRDYEERFIRGSQRMLDETFERLRLMNDTQKSVLDRRSTRAYTGEALSDDALSLLTDAALAAPSARNARDVHFVFVRNRALLEEFEAEYREIAGECAGAGDARPELMYRAPLMVFLTLPEQPKSRFSQVDAGIAVENLALSAQGMGLGSVILGRPAEVFRGKNGAEWERRLAFPEGHHFAIGIAIGHAAEERDAHLFDRNSCTRLD